MTQPFLVRRAEEGLVRHVLREHRLGRSLGEILADPYVENHCSAEQIERLLDDPAVVHSVGADVIAALRRDLAP